MLAIKMSPNHNKRTFSVGRNVLTLYLPTCYEQTIVNLIITQAASLISFLGEEISNLNTFGFQLTQSKYSEKKAEWQEFYHVKNVTFNSDPYQHNKNHLKKSAFIKDGMGVFNIVNTHLPLDVVSGFIIFGHLYFAFQGTHIILSRVS